MSIRTTYMHHQSRGSEDHATLRHAACPASLIYCKWPPKCIRSGYIHSACSLGLKMRPLIDRTRLAPRKTCRRCCTGVRFQIRDVCPVHCPCWTICGLDRWVKNEICKRAYQRESRTDVWWFVGLSGAYRPLAVLSATHGTDWKHDSPWKSEVNAWHPVRQYCTCWQKARKSAQRRFSLSPKWRGYEVLLLIYFLQGPSSGRMSSSAR